VKKYIRVWRQLTNCAVSSYLTNRIDSATYFIGKLIRFGFFILLIFSIFRFTDNLAGYGKYEVLLFFLTFNLLDVASQSLLRGIYMFKEDVRRGNFDYVISKPVNSLFYSLTKLTDILDLIFLIPVIAILIFTFWKLQMAITFLNLALYLFLVFTGLLIILGIHIISASITVWTEESENFIWLYRDTMSIGRFPPEIFSAPVQIIFTFVLPIIIIVGFPAKALLGVLSWPWIIFACIYAIAFFALSVLFWKWSLKKYSSASS
jgi:ABC-2 type transport system permease protein